jgi:hypothetical protein
LDPPNEGHVNWRKDMVLSSASIPIILYCLTLTRNGKILNVNAIPLVNEALLCEDVLNECESARYLTSPTNIMLW